jgi:hypothetical protein
MDHYDMPHSLSGAKIPKECKSTLVLIDLALAKSLPRQTTNSSPEDLLPNLVPFESPDQPRCMSQLSVCRISRDIKNGTR